MRLCQLFLASRISRHIFLATMIDSLIKNKLRGLKVHLNTKKQKKCTRSEISINLSFYVYIIPKRNNYSSNSNKKKGKWLQS